MLTRPVGLRTARWIRRMSDLVGCGWILESCGLAAGARIVACTDGFQTVRSTIARGNAEALSHSGNKPFRNTTSRDISGPGVESCNSIPNHVRNRVSCFLEWKTQDNATLGDGIRQVAPGENSLREKGKWGVSTYEVTCVYMICILLYSSDCSESNI